MRAAATIALVILAGCETMPPEVERYYRIVAGEYVTERTVASAVPEAAACISKNAATFRGSEVNEARAPAPDARSLLVRVPNSDVQVDVAPATQGSSVKLRFTPLELAARQELAERLLKGC